jgi:signal transduction histidine kinase
MTVVAALAVWISYNALNTVGEKNRTAQAIIEGMSSLSTLGTTYILYHEDRPRRQFHAQREELSRILAAADFHDPEQQRLLEALRNTTDSIQETFTRMVANFERLKSAPDDPLLHGTEERLAGQLLIRSSGGVADGLRLERLVAAEMASTHRALGIALILSMTALGFLLTGLLARTMRRIGKSLATLHHGTAVVGAGDLTHRIGLDGSDELSDFGRAFDGMTERVSDRTRELEDAGARLKRRAEQLRNLTIELTTAEERERKRLAQVLHDHLQQLLVAAKFAVEASKKATSDEARLAAIARATSLLDQTIAASRSLTAELSPPLLHDAGLEAGLRWLSRWMLDRHGLEVTFDITADSVPVPEAMRIVLFQAVRELLFNVVKHAGTRTAHVVMEVDDEVRITVLDEGNGFDAAARFDEEFTGGFGLFSIRERLESLGGRLDATSSPGRGTTVSMRVPIRNAVRDQA